LFIQTSITGCFRKPLESVARPERFELAKKPAECLEYILVHELVHLIERTHNARFIACMDKHMPEWRHRRDELNRLPVPHGDGEY
jgi:hypothetical protein